MVTVRGSIAGSDDVTVIYTGDSWETDLQAHIYTRIHRRRNYVNPNKYCC